MLIYKLLYFTLSGALFLLASHPLRREFRNENSFYTALKNVLEEKKAGALMIAIAFLNLLISTSLFFIFSNAN